MQEAMAVIGADTHALVVSFKDVARVGRINPDVVIISSGGGLACAIANTAWGEQGLAAIQRKAISDRDEIEEVFIIRRDRKSSIVGAALSGNFGLVDQSPGAAPVVGAIEARRILLDERVDAVGIAGSDRDRRLTDCLVGRREAVAGELMPGG